MKSSVGRMSLMASTGTLFSTILGFCRNLALAAAIGTGLVADSYNIANQVPNQIFLLLGGGTIAFVFVPHLMRNSGISQQRGDEYGSFLIFVGAAFALVITVALVAASPLIIKLMGGSSWDAAQSSLGLRLSLWCMPQVFFYALYAVVAQLMNARGRFSAVAWAPTANSLTIILTCLPIVVAGSIEANSPGSVGSWELIALGGSTLLGSALQAFILITILRRAGFRLFFRFRIRGLGLRTTALAGVLTLGAAVCFQLANLTAAALSTQAGSDAKLAGFDGRGYTAFFYAQTLLSVASGVAAASLANILLQRLSRHYSQHDERTAAAELNEALLAIGALLIPVMSLFICLGPLGTGVLFTRGETNYAAAHYIGIVLAVLAIGLLPYALHDVLVRPFYAVHNARTPLRSAAIIGSIRIAGSFLASVFLPSHEVLLGIAAAFSLSYAIDLPLKLRSLDVQLKFRISSEVVRGYSIALAGGLAAGLTVGGVILFVDAKLPTLWWIQSLVLVAGIASFFAVYYPITARSPASLRKLVQWLRT
ncbi:murein biosynthesis integral membrane protein MurJ [Mycobacterium sp. C3-094]